MNKRTGKALSDSQQKLSAVSLNIKQCKKVQSGITDCTIEESIESIKKAVSSMKAASVWW